MDHSRSQSRKREGEEVVDSRVLQRQRLLESSLGTPTRVALTSIETKRVKKMVNNAWKKMVGGEVNSEETRYALWRDEVRKAYAAQGLDLEGILEDGKVSKEDREKVAEALKIFRPQHWDAYKDEDMDATFLECKVCGGEKFKVIEARSITQHYAGQQHVRNIQRQTVSLHNEVYTSSSKLTAEDMSGIVTRALAGYQKSRPRITDNSLLFRLQVVRLFEELGIPATALRNKRFNDLIGGNVPGQEPVPMDVMTEAAPHALAMAEEMIVKEMDPESNRRLMESDLAVPFTPYTLIHDGSDLFGGPLSITVVRWVDEDRWEIRTRLNTVQRPASKDGSAFGVAREIQAGFVGPIRPAVIVGDGTSAQFKGMRLATGELKKKDDEEWPEDFSNSGALDGQTIVCLPHQLNNAGGKLWPAEGTFDKFVTGWRGLVAGVHKAKFVAAWKHACERADLGGSKSRWYQRSTNPGCPTRWWSTWEMLADLHYHRKVLRTFVDGEYFRSLTSDGAKNVMFAMDREGGEWIKLRLASVILFGKPLVEATYALEAEGFVAPLIAQRLDGIRRMVSQATQDTTLGTERIMLRSIGIDHGNYSARDVQRCSFKMRCFAADTLHYLARIFGWTELTADLKEKGLTTTLKSDNKERDKLLTKTARFFELAGVCIPKRPRNSDMESKERRMWEDLIQELPAAAVGNDTDRGSLMEGAMEEFEDYIRSQDVADFQLPRDAQEASSEVWEWWGERRSRWRALARVVCLLGLYVASSAPVERAFSIASHRFSDQQYSTGIDRSSMTFEVYYNEKERRKEALREKERAHRAENAR